MYQMMRMAFVSALKETGGDINLTVNTNVDSEPIARKVQDSEERSAQIHNTTNIKIAPGEITGCFVYFCFTS
jgi:hypothetical protein